MSVVLIALIWGLLGGDSPVSKPDDSGKTDAREATVSYIASGQLPDEWRTLAERTNYDETARYDETVAFCRKLAEFSPYAKYTSFGLSGEGRELPLLILSKDRSFTPERHCLKLPLQAVAHVQVCPRAAAFCPTQRLPSLASGSDQMRPAGSAAPLPSPLIVGHGGPALLMARRPGRP